MFRIFIAAATIVFLIAAFLTSFVNTLLSTSFYSTVDSVVVYNQLISDRIADRFEGQEEVVLSSIEANLKQVSGDPERRRPSMLYNPFFGTVKPTLLETALRTGRPSIPALGTMSAALDCVSGNGVEMKLLVGMGNRLVERGTPAADAWMYILLAFDDDHLVVQESRNTLLDGDRIQIVFRDKVGEPVNVFVVFQRDLVNSRSLSGIKAAPVTTYLDKTGNFGGGRYSESLKDMTVESSSNGLIIEQKANAGEFYVKAHFKPTDFRIDPSRGVFISYVDVDASENEPTRSIDNSISTLSSDCVSHFRAQDVLDDEVQAFLNNESIGSFSSNPIHRIRVMDAEQNSAAEYVDITDSRYREPSNALSNTLFDSFLADPIGFVFSHALDFYSVRDYWLSADYAPADTCPDGWICSRSAIRNEIGDEEHKDLNGKEHRLFVSVDTSEAAAKSLWRMRYAGEVVEGKEYLSASGDAQRSIFLAFLMIVLLAILSVAISIRLLMLHRAVKTRSDHDRRQRLSRIIGFIPDEVSVIAKEFRDLLDQVHRDQDNTRKIIEVVAHDISSPIAGIKDQAAQLDDGVVKKRILDHVERADLIGGALNALDEKRDFYKIKDKKAFDLMTGMLIYLADNPTYPLLKLKGDDQGYPVFLSEIALQQAIDPILQNAMRLRTEGTYIRVEILKKKKTALLSIANDGPQIPQELLPDSIFKLGVSTTNSGENGGVGLFTAHTLVTRMGGKLSAKNLPGGVAFIFELPLESK